jgi:serine/threonine protein kinase
VADDHHDIDELHAGSAVGPYDLLAPIGLGGMARVWAARVRGKTDVVAVKMLLPALAENVEFRKMFFDEARIASRVRHPNVCSTFEMGEQYGTLYLAMEWLDGPSLMRVLRPGRDDVSDCERVPIRPRIAARIVADACAGLHAAHELVGDDGRPLAVVHRDVSPHNLLMTSTGEVKVTDFGVAKALGKSHMTMAGQLKGKLAYMAPEQLIGGAIDRRCDVFALGCVLYEITTGQRPFQGEHDPQVMTSIMLGRYEPPGSLIPSYPHELAIVVMRALANEPENRYASADQMRVALENYLQKSGPQVGTAQIAALIRERCGAELEVRAAALRNEAASPSPSRDGRNAQWTGHSNGPASAPTNATNAFDSGSGAMMIEGRPAAARRGVLWVGVAALVGASLGLGVLSYVRTARRARAAIAVTDATPPTSALATSSTVTLTPSLVTVSTAAPPGSILITGAVQGRVHLRISPANAVLLVDGVVLPRGTDTIGKPADGATMNVLVRADKYEDTIVLVDSATPDEVEVTLLPNARPGAPGGANGGQPGSAVGGGGSATGAPGASPATGASGAVAKPRQPNNGAGAGSAAKDAGAPVIDAPPNPYE